MCTHTESAVEQPTSCLKRASPDDALPAPQSKISKLDLPHQTDRVLQLVKKGGVVSEHLANHEVERFFKTVGDGVLDSETYTPEVIAAHINQICAAKLLVEVSLNLGGESDDKRSSSESSSNDEEQSPPMDAAAAADVVREQTCTPRTEKKPRMVWTADIHRRFEEAVMELGVKEATPLKIKFLMNIDGVTTQNIKSHLQKYRLRLQNMTPKSETHRLQQQPKATMPTSMAAPSSVIPTSHVSSWPSHTIHGSSSQASWSSYPSSSSPYLVEEHSTVGVGVEHQLRAQLAWNRHEQQVRQQIQLSKQAMQQEMMWKYHCGVV